MAGRSKEIEVANPLPVNLRILLKLWLGFLIVFNTSTGFSCPAIFLANSIPYKNKYEFQRKNISLYAFERGLWVQKAIQFNDIKSDGTINYDLKANRLKAALKPSDRIVVHPQSFSKKAPSGVKFPCSSTKMIELRNGRSYGYLVFCKDEQKQLDPQIHYNAEERILQANRYSYSHDSSNHLNFKSINLKINRSDETIAYDAEQLIRADVKNFFTMNFKAGDVTASLEKDFTGSVSYLALLRFYLKILFFSIDISLTPEVHFFRDSLYMPMSLYSPVNAQRYLNKGSGIFYSWKTSPKLEWSKSKSKMPRFIAKGKYHKEFKSYCRRKYCTFTLQGLLDKQDIRMIFSIDQSLVEKKFYPQVYWDMQKPIDSFEEDLSDDPQGRMGVFFETSQLPKGGHFWDFWVSMGKNYRYCPISIRLKSLSAHKSKR